MKSSPWIVPLVAFFSAGAVGLACTSGSGSGAGGNYLGNSVGGIGGSSTGGTGGSGGDGGSGGSGAGGTGDGGSGGTDIVDGGGSGGDDGSTGGSGGVPPDAYVDAPAGCIPIGLTAVETNPASPSTALLSFYSPDTGGSAPDQLWIEWKAPGGGSMSTGSFDLSQAPDNDLATCTHCVRVAEDIVSGEATKTYFPESGTLYLDGIDNPLNGQSKGSLLHLKLVEVTVDDTTLETTPVPNGSCLFLSYASWDLLVDPVDSGTTCQNAEECGDPAQMICDPATATCQPEQCDKYDVCQDLDKICIAQVSAASIGACYPECEPFVSGSGCSPSQECVSASWDQATGYCNARGTHALGTPCTRIDLTTDCTAGNVCKNIGSDVSPDFRCVQQCNFFGTTTTKFCTDPDFSCFVGGTCLETTQQTIDDASIGELCTIQDFVHCGLNTATGLAEGTCDSYFTPGQFRCYRWCRMGNNADCNGNGVCSDAMWNNGLGDCK